MKCKFLSAMFVLFLSGVSTAVADLTDNPAEIYFLGLSSPAVKSLSEEMLATARAISEQKENYFDAETSVCTLEKNDDVYSSIVGMDPSAMRELMDSIKKGGGHCDTALIGVDQINRRPVQKRPSRREFYSDCKSA